MTKQQILADLQAAWALIDSPEKWTQDVPARDKEGGIVAPSEDSAVCWCSWGAVYKVTTPEGQNICDYSRLDPVIEYLKEFCEQSIVYFNDSHTWPEVRDVWQRAIQKLQAEVQS